MDTFLITVWTALVLFAGTNIDDMFVLVVLNASSRAGGRPARWQIWAGQYAGVAIIVAISLAAGRGLTIIPLHWIWLLGLIPFGLGIIKLAGAVRARREGSPAPAALATGLPGITGVTIANGGDNLAAYTAVFATIGGGATAVTITVFAACVPVWCLTGSWLVSHRHVTHALRRWGHWAVPAVYILIGLYVFAKAAAHFS